MREIKFRAWVERVGPNGTDRQFLMPVETIYFQNTDTITNELDVMVNGLRWDKSEVSQFTGLHDKNQKEIWERDIVKVIWIENPLQVVFSEGCFVFDVKESEESPEYYAPIIADECEVIGNIYENPDLLK